MKDEGRRMKMPVGSPNDARLEYSSADYSDYARSSIYAIPWKIARTRRGERTKIAAVRHNGNMTDYHTFVVPGHGWHWANLLTVNRSSFKETALQSAAA